jgi:two-component system response regulator MprA
MLAFRLLVVADDEPLRHQLARALEHDGFVVQARADATTALARLDAPPDGFVIEVDLPDGDGRDLRRALQARGIDAPALFLTAPETPPEPRPDTDPDADDYLAKPVRAADAVGRVRAMLQRSPAGAPITFRTLWLDPVMHAVRGELGAMSLTPTEFRVLAALAERGGVIIPRRDLVRAAWPEDAIVSDNSLDQYIARLRDKLRNVTAQTAIVTTRRVGYRLEGGGGVSGLARPQSRGASGGDARAGGPRA